MNNLERIIRTVEVGQLNWYGRDDVVYLLSIIEQAEKALNDIADSKYITIVTVRKLAEEALQAIRKGD